MSNRDYILAAIYAVIITVVLSFCHFSRDSVAPAWMLFFRPYHSLAEMLIFASMLKAIGWLAILVVSFVGIVILRLASWLVNDFGRDFIRSSNYGADTLDVVFACVFYLASIWLSPINYHPMANLGYAISLLGWPALGHWFFGLALIIPGATLSSHIAEVEHRF
jgi:hypothetical protein